MARHRSGQPQEDPPQHRRPHRRTRRGNRPRGMLGHRPGASLHVQGGAARCGEFPVLCRQGAVCARRPGPAVRDADECHHARANRPGRRHHAVEHALHAVDLEDRAGARRRLHGRSQAGGILAGHRPHPDGYRRGSRSAGGRLEPRQRFRRGRRQGADRTPRHQGDRLCRRVEDRLNDHETGRRHA